MVVWLLLAGMLAAAGPGPAYVAEVEAWRARREAALRSDTGWLAVAGLVWLKPGANTFGSAADNDVVLPASVPAHAGTFELSGKATRVRLAPGVSATVGGEPAEGRELRADDAGAPDVLSFGRVTVQVIARGGRYGIRVKDLDAETRKRFGGLQWFTVDESLRVVARFVPHPAPKAIPIANVLGQVSDMPSPGQAVFRLGGKTHRLDAVLEEPDAKELFFMFRDGTTGKETYPAGRFLYAPLPENGRVVLDFNKAYSPPCAFTAFATCPLPPRQNRLAVRIEAGEKYSGGH